MAAELSELEKKSTAVHARIIGVTGPPGAGKSTLVGRLITHYRGQGKRVGVLAVDPTSPITGGAVLGDRLRMQQHATDPEVFIRSMATRGATGGLAAGVRDATRALAAHGYDLILIETVGVGQDQVEIVRVAGVVLVVVAPGWGDEIQALKAGVLEVGDIVVVNKADLPGAAEAMHHLKSMGIAVVVSTVATEGTGVAELAHEIARVGATSRSPAVSRVGAGLAPAHDVSRPVVDHVAIAVPDLAAFQKLYTEVLGLPLERTEDVPTEKVRTGFFAGTPGSAGMHLELIAPLDPGDETCSTVRFLKEKGGGLHHLAVRVADIKQALARARKAGYQVVEPAPRPGAGGTQVAFLHPKSTGKVLIELVQKP